MSDNDVPLVYFRGEFEIAGKLERLVIVISPSQRKIVFADYEENAKEIAKQMEEKYLSGDDEPTSPAPGPEPKAGQP